MRKLFETRTRKNEEESCLEVLHLIVSCIKSKTQPYLLFSETNEKKKKKLRKDEKNIQK
jgi:hypothetical protein